MPPPTARLAQLKSRRAKPGEASFFFFDHTFGVEACKVLPGEYFVHHEDVRRALDGWQPRALDRELISDLTSAVRRMARLMTRKAPCGIVLEPTTSNPIVARSGEPHVVLRGDIGEIVLFLFGRQEHTCLEITGPDDMVDAVRRASFGV